MNLPAILGVAVVIINLDLEYLPRTLHAVFSFVHCYPPTSGLHNVTKCQWSNHDSNPRYVDKWIMNDIATINRGKNMGMHILCVKYYIHKAE